MLAEGSNAVAQAENTVIESLSRYFKYLSLSIWLINWIGGCMFFLLITQPCSCCCCNIRRSTGSCRKNGYVETSICRIHCLAFTNWGYRLASISFPFSYKIFIFILILVFLSHKLMKTQFQSFAELSVYKIAWGPFLVSFYCTSSWNFFGIRDISLTNEVGKTLTPMGDYNQHLYLETK